MTFAAVEIRDDGGGTVRIEIDGIAVRVVIATVMTVIVETVVAVIETIEIAEEVTIETVVEGTGLAAADAMSAGAVTTGIEVAVMIVIAVKSKLLYSLDKSDKGYKTYFATYSRECSNNIKF